MAKSIEELYQEIAKLMNAAIPEDWVRAWIKVEPAGESALDMVGCYKKADSNESHSFRISPQIARDLSELRQRMKQPDTDPWRRAVFNLLPDGQFHLELDYSG